MRLVKSIEVSVSSVAGSSPPAVFLRETVGSDSSSATKGSSVASDAGKKRLPAKPWAKALPAAAARSAPPSTASVLFNRLSLLSFSARVWLSARSTPHGRSRVLQRKDQERAGGARGGAAG